VDVPPQHRPVAVSRHHADLLHAEACLEERADCPVAQVVEVQVLALQIRDCAGRSSA
jgi:hypothetical protein